MLFQSVDSEKSHSEGPKPQTDIVAVRPPGILRLRSRAWRVAGAYALFAVVWIYFSDRALEALIPDPGKLIQVSVYKGFGFVLVTSVLLLLMVRSAFGRIEDDYELLKAHEVEIERLTRLYAALSQINQAIVWTNTREELFSKVCQVLLDFGGFRIAWIGWHDVESRRLVPVAVKGDGSDYIDNFRGYTDDRPEGRGLSGMAFREGRHFVCNDLLHNTVPFPGRAEAEKRGLRASAAFPIRLKGEVCGTLSVYADSTGFFQDKEIALLLEAAVDISFGLDNLAREEEREAVESALKQSEQRYRTTVHSILEGCQIIDFDWTYLYLNSAAEVHNRRPNSELLGNRMPEMWPGIEETRPFHLIRQCLEDRVASQDEVEFTFPDGGTGWFDLRAQPVPEGAFVLSIDITERHRAEMALRELNEGLEMRVAKRTDELQAALVRAEAADRLKSAFLATMSHELRTPLNSIIGFTGIILKGMAGPLNPEQSKQLGMVAGSARHLLELINDVLDLSKVEAGQLDVYPEPFDMNESIERVMESVRPFTEKKGLALSLRGPDTNRVIISDRRRVEQIMLNLLNNAIKFTESGEVVLAADFSVPGKLKISVKDTGIGIKEEDMNTLFQPFRQIDSGLTRQHEGTGLGLAICRRLAALLGGDISAESKRGEGSTFTLMLPLEPATAS